MRFGSPPCLLITLVMSAQLIGSRPCAPTCNSRPNRSTASTFANELTKLSENRMAFAVGLLCGKPQHRHVGHGRVALLPVDVVPFAQLIETHILLGFRRAQACPLHVAAASDRDATTATAPRARRMRATRKVCGRVCTRRCICM